jgi:hypothetical protein
VHRMGAPGNDIYQAACLAGAAVHALQEVRPRAIIYSSSHAALLQPRRSMREAVWLDGPIANMRAGVRNAPIRALERTRQSRLDLAMGMSLQHLEARTAPLRCKTRVALHSPVDPSSPEARLPPGLEPPFAVTYVSSPGGKGLDLAVDAWRRAEPGMPLVVTGITAEAVTAYIGSPLPATLRVIGPVSRPMQRAIVRHAAFYVSASRSEQYGIAQLEALADRVRLVSVPSRGVSDQVTLARRLHPMLVAQDVSSESLAISIANAIGMTAQEVSAYQARAADVMSSYSYVSFKRRLEQDVVPLLLG